MMLYIRGNDVVLDGQGDVLMLSRDNKMGIHTHSTVVKNWVVLGERTLEEDVKTVSKWLAEKYPNG